MTTRVERPVYNIEIKIIFEDKDMLVVDKPPSMPVHPCGAYNYNSCVKILVEKFGYKFLKRWLKSCT